MSKQINIHPLQQIIEQRSKKEALLNQYSKVIWFTGLSGSGKSTLALSVERELHKMGILCVILDGDNIRSGINNNLGFSQVDRQENIRRIAEIAKLFLNSGIVVLASFISPTHKIRDMATTIIGSKDFIEVYMSTPLSVCEQRDVKGLYKKARQGEIPDFTGVSSAFEEPSNPAITVDASQHNIEECTTQLLSLILASIRK